MTEEIIIDGVNVAGCANLDSLICNCGVICKGRDCYYKQLKRLEQENKELKEKIIELSEEKGHLIVENNTLKESNQSLSILGTDLASAHETVRKEFFRADKNKDMWREKAEEYRSALKEINHILEIHKDELEECLHNDIDGMIQNKINEVLQ
jgi:flagellar biosynthesis chaperone FliJ